MFTFFGYICANDMIPITKQQHARELIVSGKGVVLDFHSRLNKGLFESYTLAIIDNNYSYLEVQERPCIHINVDTSDLHDYISDNCLHHFSEEGGQSTRVGEVEEVSITKELLTNYIKEGGYCEAV